jgi:hypothetical protein
VGRKPKYRANTTRFIKIPLYLALSLWLILLVPLLHFDPARSHEIDAQASEEYVDMAFDEIIDSPAPCGATG